jgi:Lon protease-like protein
MKPLLSQTFVCALTAFVFAFTPGALADAFRGTVVHDEKIRVSPSADSARVGDATRGIELIVIDTSSDWVHVEAILRPPSNEEGATEDESEGKAVTGWIPNRSLVTPKTQDGDRVIFGEAADSEDQASRRRGRRDSAQDAMRLYYRLYDLMPASPLAAEALYRAADIRWQLERADVMTRPSARERENYMRGQMREDWMKIVMKKYSGTKWADLAAFRLLENKLCGEWEGLPKCPDKEADLYENYAKDHPQSPSAAEALYDAAWRRAALIEIYKTEPNQKKAEEAKDRAIALAQRVISQYLQTDWAYRAQRLIFYMQAGIATYGNASD